MNYSFLVDTYATERLKTLNVWSMFRDNDMDIRPHPLLERDRTAHEHMVHYRIAAGRRVAGRAKSGVAGTR